MVTVLVADTVIIVVIITLITNFGFVFKFLRPLLMVLIQVGETYRRKACLRQGTPSICAEQDASLCMAEVS